MTEISFKSRIMPVKQKDFGKIAISIGKKYFSDYPWTINSTVIGENVFTTDIRDCTTCIITDGQKAALMHINPLARENHDFKPIETLIKNNFVVENENVQGLIIGSKLIDLSEEIYFKFVNLLKSLKIPFTELKDSLYDSHIAYKSSTDEYYVASQGIDKALEKGENAENIFKYLFREVKINELDELV